MEYDIYEDSDCELIFEGFECIVIVFNDILCFHFISHVQLQGRDFQVIK